MPEPGVERRVRERRADHQARRRLGEIHEGYKRFTRVTIAILAVLAVAQLGLGGLSIYLLSQQDQAAANTHRIDAVICAQIHYLERGLQLTGLDPKQSVVHNELKILLAELRPLARDCPPAKPFTSPGPAEGAWENP